MTKRSELVHVIAFTLQMIKILGSTHALPTAFLTHVQCQRIAQYCFHFHLKTGLRQAWCGFARSKSDVRVSLRPLFLNLEISDTATTATDSL